MRVIATEADIDEGLAFLGRRDRRLETVIAAAGPVPLRRHRDGFAGLARIIVGQQVSIASAAAIWSRLQAAFPTLDAAAINDADDEALRAVGLSRPKIRTLRAVAAACGAGLDFEHLPMLSGEEAHGRLTAIKGIGPWTADIYLLFCLGHADIFPAGDLALRHAVAEGLGRDAPIPVDDLVELARDWSPWRGVAARLFWSYYRVMRERVAVPV